jgi:transcription initiation factor IIF auxiliary subunit
MDKLADGLQKLNEDDLLQVVQMVHDHKTPDSYTKNDVESTSKLFHPNPVSSRPARALSDGTRERGY